MAICGIYVRFLGCKWWNDFRINYRILSYLSHPFTSPPQGVDAALQKEAENFSGRNKWGGWSKWIRDVSFFLTEKKKHVFFFCRKIPKMTHPPLEEEGRCRAAPNWGGEWLLFFDWRFLKVWEIDSTEDAFWDLESQVLAGCGDLFGRIHQLVLQVGWGVVYVGPPSSCWQTGFKSFFLVSKHIILASRPWLHGLSCLDDVRNDTCDTWRFGVALCKVSDATTSRDAPRCSFNREARTARIQDSNQIANRKLLSLLVRNRGCPVLKKVFERRWDFEMLQTPNKDPCSVWLGNFVAG